MPINTFKEEENSKQSFLVQMKASSTLFVLLLLLLLNCTIFPTNGKTFVPIGHDKDTHQIYIVHVTKPSDKKFHLFKHRKEWYMSYLPNATLSSGWPRLVYAYRQVITGFAAWLTQEEVSAMTAMEGFLFSQQDNDVQHRTTYTYNFVGLTSDSSPGMWYDSNYGAGQIIGVIDTGLKPNHPSFGDLGVPPPDLNKWNGSCYWGPPICNNKLIGAQGFSRGMSISPLDKRGHGTYCASVAAGHIVQNASVNGAAQGKAAGMAPKAHLAIYKIGSTADILKCIEKAIQDHVDVLSISQGSGKQFIYSAIIKGAFAASIKGIVTCAAAPNEGPTPSSIDNDAPWVITVGACTTDRKITSIVELGDGQQFFGESVAEGNGFATPQLPLVNVGTCYRDIGKHNVVGKIAICDSTYNPPSTANIVKNAGGLGVIVISGNGNYTQPRINSLPASHVTSDDGTKIEEYFLSSPNPTAAIIFRGTQFDVKPAPAVAIFSGRGPSLQNGDIIKPDIIAPGVNILVASPSGQSLNRTGNQATFSFQSGTSMATPHVAGIAALLKHNHPTWSPAAIQSAIMTTAKSKDLDGNPITDQDRGKIASAFDMGSGMIQPVAANDPGLIYDIKPQDYIRYLCGSGLFSDKDVSTIIGGNISCSNVRGIKPKDLNYPSIGVTLSATSPSVTLKRTVTNVGDADSEYKLYLNDPEGVRIDVSPKELSFKTVGETQSYDVTISFKTVPMPPGDHSEGQLGWFSGKHLVRSPVAVTFV